MTTTDTFTPSLTPAQSSQRPARTLHTEGAFRVAPWLLMAAGIAVYLNSLSAPFVFDDKGGIIDNAQIRSLWPLTHFLAAPRYEGLFSRPIISFTLAFNYALGGLNVVGYHLTNLFIHVLAGVTLYGLLRRTLALPRLQPRVGTAGPGLALAGSLLWLVHPLQTASVTYLIQRCESLMGWCYLFALYSVVRGATSSARSNRWYASAIVSCALGMGCKPVMVTAPFVIWLYDRTFLSGGWGRAWRQRRGLYLGLAATWGWLAFLLLSAPRLKQPAAGFGLHGVTPVAYALTQLGVIVHYFTLSVWPHPLCLDYGWPITANPIAMIIPAFLMTSAAFGTAWAWRRRPVLSFLGLWVFVILAPTSSVIPLKDPAFEHRMYLPLAGVLMLFVSGGWALIQRLPLSAVWRQRVAVGCVAVVALMLGWATVARNADYHSAVTMWSRVVAARPMNARALTHLGVALVDDDRIEEARQAFAAAVRLNPADATAHADLGIAAYREGRVEEAIAHYRAAARLAPTDARTHDHLGLALASQGKLNEAIGQYMSALLLQPDFAGAHNNLGIAFASQGWLDEAIAQYVEALRLQPDFVEAHNNLGLALANQGQFEEAVTHYTIVLRLQPDSAEGHNNLGIVLARQGKWEEAAHYFSRALELQEDYPDAQHNLELIRKQQGQ